MNLEDSTLLTLFGDLQSGNVHKAPMILWRAGVPDRRVDTVRSRDDARTGDGLRINPIGKIPTLMLLCLGLAVQPAWAAKRSPWTFGAGVSAFSEDNVTRAGRTADIEADTILSVRADGSYGVDITPDHGIIFNGFARVEDYRTFDGVSNRQLGLKAEYRFRTRRGFTAPTYSLYVSRLSADYDADNRDGSTVEYGIRVRRRFTDRIAVAAGAAAKERTADGRVFDLERNRYFVHLDYRLTSPLLAYLAYNRIDGDIYSINSIDPTTLDGGYAGAVEWDPAFSIEQPKWAYRYDGKTDVFRLGFNFSINRTNAIDFSVDAVDSQASNGGGYESGYGYGGTNPPAGGYPADALAYETTVFALGYLHRF